MTLGDLIGTLQTMPRDALVEWDDGTVPDGFDSWRGVYKELALGHTRQPRKPVTVQSLLAECHAADGKTFEGYKGGDYLMSRDTPVWKDNYGEYHEDGITRVSLEANGRVVLWTADLSHYRQW